MMIQSLLGEFEHEVENTRKLLKAIPDSALDYKPSEHRWTTGQLASHIAELYNWFDDTFNVDAFEMTDYKYDKGDISKVANILNKFEENVKKAQAVIKSYPEEKLFHNWAMTIGGKEAMPAMPRINAIRSFLFNHIYHHRGELIVYLRASGNTVPSLYGPTYEETIAMQAN